MSKEIADLLVDLVRGFDRRVHAADDNAWGNPSPCEGWSATDVVNHVAGNLNAMAAALTGTAPAELDATDPVGSWDAASERMLSILPLSHMLEQTGGLYLPLLYGGSISYLASRQPATMFKAIRERRVTTMLSSRPVDTSVAKRGRVPR